MTGVKPWGLGYKRSKSKAKRIYSKIGNVACPAFGGELVAFTSAGFNHLVRKGRVPRTRNEQKRRFTLIPHVAKIISDPRAHIVYRQEETKVITNQHGQKIATKSVADFWTFAKLVGGRRIKVVIRQLRPNGKKHFFSVMID